MEEPEPAVVLAEEPEVEGGEALLLPQAASPLARATTAVHCRVTRVRRDKAEGLLR